MVLSGKKSFLIDLKIIKFLHFHKWHHLIRPKIAWSLIFQDINESRM